MLKDAQEQVVDAKGLTKVELQVICSGRKAALVPVWIKIKGEVASLPAAVIVV